MRSTVYDVLPTNIRKSLKKLGGDIATARKKRKITVAMMAERMGVSKSTYLRVEEGNPSVALGVYAMTLFVLGLSHFLANLIDPSKDDQGLLLDEERLPKRVRVKKDPAKS